jgi:hypothetical protein
MRGLMPAQGRNYLAMNLTKTRLARPKSDDHPPGIRADRTLRSLKSQ